MVESFLASSLTERLSTYLMFALWCSYPPGTKSNTSQPSDPCSLSLIYIHFTVPQTVVQFCGNSAVQFPVCNFFLFSLTDVSSLFSCNWFGLFNLWHTMNKPSFLNQWSITLIPSKALNLVVLHIKAGGRREGNFLTI